MDIFSYKGEIVLKKNLLTISVFLSLLLVASAALAGCSDDFAAIEGEKSEAKTSDDKGKEENEKDEDADTKEDKEKEDDIWTYYDDATWNDNWNGLKSEIQKVVVTDNAPEVYDDEDTDSSSAVGMKFKMENTTDHKFETYPDQATLVTSTGEQVEADMFISDHLGGDIDKGVIKEGDVVFFLERGEAESIEWVKFEWTVTDSELEDQGDYDNDTKNYEVELELK